MQFIVPRVSNDEFTAAVVTLRDDPRWSNPDRPDLVLQAVQAACTEWAATTESGRQSFEETSGDFNIGDLSLELSDPTLQEILAKHRVYNLRVTCYGSAVHGWTYDTHLMGPQ
jgi:hypothetical protein